jgi:hypothetical protein
MAKRTSPASRHQWTEADARHVLADWQRSGLTLEAFARSRGLVPQRLAWWRKRLRATRPDAITSMTFVPAEVIGTAGAADGPAAVIRLRDGIVIELDGASPSWIAAFARELARSPS